MKKHILLNESTLEASEIRISLLSVYHFKQQFESKTIAESISHLSVSLSNPAIFTKRHQGQMIAGWLSSSSYTNAFDEIRSQRRKKDKRKKNLYKFNQLCVHCLHVKENEERGGAEVKGQEI